MERLIKEAVAQALAEYRHELELKEEEIADRAAKKAVDLMKDDAARAVGRAIFGRIFWAIGIVALYLLYWAQTKGIVK